MHSHDHWMRLAISTTRQGIAAGQTPFGSCIIRNDALIVSAHNQVWAHHDPTAHAEVQAIRQACAALQTIDLSGCVLYSTCEPCPMCFSACHWAKLTRIVYGAQIADAQIAGFSELTLSNQDLKRLGHSPIEIVSGVLREECAQLFTLWRAHPQARTY